MITVLMPVYNAARILGPSVQSILSQSFSDFELLIADDGSTDDTEQMVGSFADPRIRYIRFPHRGLPETLNDGLNSASFDIVARMDAGDLAHPDRLAFQYAEMAKNPENTVIATGYAVFSGDRIRYTIRRRRTGVLDPSALALHVPFAHSSVMYRKSFIGANGGYRHGDVEDYDLWLRVVAKARFLVLHDVLMYTEYTEGRLSTLNAAAKYSAIYRIQEQYYNDMHEYFPMSDIEERFTRGWREYFFGDPQSARFWWVRTGRRLFLRPRVWAAWCVSFLPKHWIVALHEQRIRLQLEYFSGYFTAENRAVRSRFTILNKGAA
jgi:glycosyltransferase involved in cell wall biosynthesis